MVTLRAEDKRTQRTSTNSKDSIPRVFVRSSNRRRLWQSMQWACELHCTTRGQQPTWQPEQPRPQADLCVLPCCNSRWRPCFDRKRRKPTRRTKTTACSCNMSPCHLHLSSSSQSSCCCRSQSTCWANRMKKKRKKPTKMKTSWLNSCCIDDDDGCCCCCCSWLRWWRCCIAFVTHDAH